LGELITLIEDDKRLSKSNEIIVELPYSKKPFGVPPNLYIIGTMNTADRSVEALDAALRRRFSFEEMPPNPNLVELKYELEGILANKLLETINKRLEKLLDKDHLIGHSFFIRINEEDEETTLRKAFYDKIIPLLQEYFYGDYGKIGLVLGKGFVRIKETDKEKIFADFDYNEKEAFSDREVYEIVSNPTRTDLVLALKKLMNIKVEQN
jgi:5-methylcytosine-specific restriction protein B